MSTNPKLIFIVLISLAAITLFGMTATYSLIVMKADAALIALVLGPTTTALGGILSMLNNTRSQPTGPVPTEVINPPDRPVPVAGQNQ